MHSTAVDQSNSLEVERNARSSAFRNSVSLETLLAPVRKEEFLREYWEKKPLVVHRGAPSYYGDLFTLEDFDESTRGGRGYVKTAEATAKKQSKHYGTAPGALENILTDMRDGHTLILDGMHAYDPKLGHMCRMLAQETGAIFQTNLYLTPPSGKGFMPHWDNHDVFVLQVMGSKHWKIEKARRTLPEKESQIEDEGRELRGELLAFTLNQGDVVYIPRGYVHAAECGSESSLHITLGVYPPTWDDLLLAAVRSAIIQDDTLRLALPLGYMRAHDAPITEKIANVLKKVADNSFLGAVLDQFRDEMVKKASLDISGQIASFHQGRKLQLDDVMGRREGLLYTTRKGESSVTLHVGTRAITFPDFFGPALELALSKRSFAIRELPGDLEDDERIVFVERLVQEALLLRQ